MKRVKAALSFSSAVSVAEQRLGGLKINVTELVQPEIVESIGSLTECILIKTFINLPDGFVQFTQNPTVQETFVKWID
jgi:hypothetical protein